MMISAFQSAISAAVWSSPSWPQIAISPTAARTGGVGVAVTVAVGVTVAVRLGVGLEVDVKVGVAEGVVVCLMGSTGFVEISGLVERLEHAETNSKTEAAISNIGNW
jgi:hypothetical protein